jgi:hypothetical protein
MPAIIAYFARTEQQNPFSPTALADAGKGTPPPRLGIVPVPDDDDDDHGDDGMPPDEPPDGEEDVFASLEGETTAGYLERVTRDVARRFEDRDLQDAAYLCQVVRECLESNPEMRGGPWCPPMRSRELRAAEAFLCWLQRTAGMDRLLAERGGD